LGDFILTSENYHNLMEKVIEKEVRMREAKRDLDEGDSISSTNTIEIDLD